MSESNIKELIEEMEMRRKTIEREKVTNKFL